MYDATIAPTSKLFDVLLVWKQAKQDHIPEFSILEDHFPDMSFLWRSSSANRKCRYIYLFIYLCVY